ncbi:MAG TPA: MarR family transcriptional regulator [Acidimicrobiales bacterium]|nr:MarR family transcriptional regulator [Acidimicrobiales bacterium]
MTSAVHPVEVKDEVDILAEFWRETNPELDSRTKTLSVRLRRAAHHLERALRQELAANEIEMWEAEVLLALRRGAEHCLSAGELLRESQVTSGAITNRVARLEQRGWVRRDIDPGDRRHVLVTLTPEGLARADQLLATKIQCEQALLGKLDREAQDRLNNDLRRLLVALEGPAQLDAPPPVERRPDLPPP